MGKQNTEHLQFPKGVVASEEDRERLRALVDRLGEPEACKAIGLSRFTVARCLAGLTVQKASAELLTHRLGLEAARQ